MKRKVCSFLLLMLAAANCMACSLPSDTAETSEKSGNPLIEYGYDAEVDTVTGYYGKPIQHLTSFVNNTIQLSCPTPNRWKGFYTWKGFRISDFYVKMGEASFKGMNAAVLSPITMTTAVDIITDSIFTDRLLAIEYKGRRWVYTNVIRNTEAETMLSFENITAGEEGIELSFEAGQGYKYAYNILINMYGGQPCLSNIYVDEHNSSAKYQATHQFDFTSFGDEGDFPLYRYRRHFPMLLRMGNYDAFGE